MSSAERLDLVTDQFRMRNASLRAAMLLLDLRRLRLNTATVRLSDAFCGLRHAVRR